jgi:putative ABC transport system permease protein
MLRTMRALWRNLVQRKRVEGELNDELSAYVDLLTAEKIEQGMERSAARRAALLQLGGMDQVKEEVREVRVGARVERVLQDANYALRALIRSPGFASASILALALGIGVTTSIFSVVYGVLLRPLPYPQPEELVRVWMSNPTQGIDKDVTSYPMFRAWRERGRQFEQMVVVRNVILNLTGQGDPEELRGESVSENFFDLFGVMPRLGAPFTREQAAPDGSRAVVLSHELWATRFASDRSIIGRSIQLSGEAYPVVGVMPPGFREAQFWIPLHFRGGLEGMRETTGALWLPVLGRLRDGVTVAQAQQEMSRIGKDLSTELSNARDTGVLLEPLRASMVGNSRTPLLVLLGAVVLVLLIACANIANLLLARGSTRRGELSVRIALGAGRGALVRQVLVESLVLGLIGGALGTLFAWAGVQLLIGFGSESLPRLDAIRVDGAVLGFSLLASLLASILFGAVPAIDVARHQPHELLRSGGRSAVRGAAGVRPALIAGQFAIALVLLYSAGLMLRSFSNLLTVDQGFDARNVLLVNVNLPRQRYNTGAASNQFYDQLLSRTRAIPGVESADMISSLLLSRLPNSASIVLEGKPNLPPGDENLPVAYDAVSPTLLRTLRMNLLRGRGFEVTDRAGTPYVAIINESFVRRFFKNENPIGQRFSFGRPDNDSGWINIVGVVRDAKRSGVDQEVMPYAFLPYSQIPQGRMQVVVRTSGDPLLAVPNVREAMRAIDPMQPISNVRTLEQDLAKGLAPRRFVMLLLASFAGAAVVLAAIGIYGVLSYMVSRRTREFGVRMALGAEPRQMLQLVMRQAGKQVGVGVVIGLAGALVAGRLIRAQLFGVPAVDTWTQAAVVLILCAVAVVAVWVPARRATGADPLIALRTD